MKLLTRKGILRTELFKEVMYHEGLGIITFSYSYLDADKEDHPNEIVIQLPMVFKDSRRARQAFKKYLRARNTSKEQVSLLDFRCSWSRNTYKRIICHKKFLLLGL